MALARDSVEQLIYTPDGKCYACFSVSGHREQWIISSKSFRNWLSFLYYKKHDKRVPNNQALQDAIGTLSGQAQFEGLKASVYVRVALHDTRMNFPRAMPVLCIPTCTGGSGGSISA